MLRFLFTLLFLVVTVAVVGYLRNIYLDYGNEALASAFAACGAAFCMGISFVASLIAWQDKM